MVCGRGRIIHHELLDEQSPAAAEPSLRDLVRINRLLGGHEVLRNALASLYRAEDRFTVLDVGAASGDMGRVIQTRYPFAQVTSLDYKASHLELATPPRVAADAFRMPFRNATFDVVHCSLFLHHFEDSRVVELLREFGKVAARHVIVSDLERHMLAYYFLPATRWLFAWDAITLHDGPISVEAAFKGPELHALAVRARLRDVKVTTHRPAFRLCLISSPPG